MKQILLILGVVLGLAPNSFAKGIPKYPTINFPQAIAVSELCTDGETIKTKKPVTVCTEYKVSGWQICRMGEAEICRTAELGKSARGSEYVKEEFACAQTETRVLSVKRTYFVEECSRWSYPAGEGSGPATCTGTTEVVTKVIPLAYKVDIVETAGEVGERVLRSENYYLEPCPVVKIDQQVSNK